MNFYNSKYSHDHHFERETEVRGERRSRLSVGGLAGVDPLVVDVDRVGQKVDGGLQQKNCKMKRRQILVVEIL